MCIALFVRILHGYQVCETQVSRLGLELILVIGFGRVTVNPVQMTELCQTYIMWLLAPSKNSGVDSLAHQRVVDRELN